MVYTLPEMAVVMQIVVGGLNGYGDGEYFDVRNRVELGERVEDILHERVTARFDEDGDRVLDEHDKCPGTPRGFKVDENGCALVYTFNLLFDKNSSEVKPEFMKTVKDLADYQKKTGIAFELRGYTDITGSQQYNQKLSKQRAEAVMEKLIELGVAPAKLSSKGLGSKEPVADNSTTAGRDKNRRVEAVIKPR
jgi:OOP family OmpA-OmpF porin